MSPPACCETGPSLAVVVRLKSLVRQPCRHPALGACRPFVDEGDCGAPFMAGEPVELRLRAGVENELKARFRALGKVSLTVGAFVFRHWSAPWSLPRYMTVPLPVTKAVGRIKPVML